MPWLAHPGIEGIWRETRFRARIRLAARRAARLFTPSSTVAADLLRLCPSTDGRISVLPFGVEEIFRPLAAGEWSTTLRLRFGLPDGPIVLFVGKARRKKNLPVLLNALGRLRREMRPEPVLVLAGVDPGETPPTPGVRALGFVSDADLVRLYNLARVLAYPSVSEGFGFPPLEAMACGVPVVAGDAGAVPETVRDAALLVDPASPEDLAGALRAAMEDAAIREGLTSRGHARAAAFTWGGTAARALAAFGAATA
jgi:alpha-1,3-rhamnosyl/mannosyltransferase